MVCYSVVINAEDSTVASWYNSLFFCILLSVCCCPPVGIILFWTNPNYSRDIKIVFTIVFIVWMLGSGGTVVNNYHNGTQFTSVQHHR
ncbi:MAG: hypothetical protein JO316_24945 [Abitibacteriaceae bacterium]|nr:hypothetical protein [Abditibacteriaceae bacterium]MBV9868616.1 hypothetical protein [Abditibacteriaceae bacterium]